VISEALDYDTFLKGRSTFFAFLFSTSQAAWPDRWITAFAAVISEAHDYTTTCLAPANFFRRCGAAACREVTMPG
jgi:hypothetical protein